jgi:hypothetical protein
MWWLHQDGESKTERPDSQPNAHAWHTPRRDSKEGEARAQSSGRLPLAPQHAGAEGQEYLGRVEKSEKQKTAITVSHG